ncbi:MAG: GIY-YIG nuclease family protein [Candidatus Ratteibacteria bacterium]
MSIREKKAQEMHTKAEGKETAWYVYMLRCCNNAFYTGITTDVSRRITEHLAGKGGKFTRSFTPVELVFMERCRTKAEALIREASIKRMRKKEKKEMIAGYSSKSLNCYSRRKEK